MPNSFYTEIVLFFFFFYKKLNDQTVLFQTIQFSIITQFSSIRPIDRTLSGATTPGQSETGCVSHDRVLRIPQSYTITEASPSDCFVSYPEHSLEESYPSAEI